MEREGKVGRPRKSFQHVSWRTQKHGGGLHYSRNRHYLELFTGWIPGNWPFLTCASSPNDFWLLFQWWLLQYNNTWNSTWTRIFEKYQFLVGCSLQAGFFPCHWCDSPDWDWQCWGQVTALPSFEIKTRHVLIWLKALFLEWTIMIITWISDLLPEKENSTWHRLTEFISSYTTLHSTAKTLGQVHATLNIHNLRSKNHGTHNYHLLIQISKNRQIPFWS